MGVYRYIAVPAAGGAQVRGELVADSSLEVRRALRSKGLAPLKVTQALQRHRARVLSLVTSRLLRSRRTGRLVEFYENLSALLGTGTRLSEALALLASGNHRGRGRQTATLCRRMHESIKSGQSFSETTAQHDTWFSAVDVALLASAEQAGELDSTLAQLAEHHSRGEALRGALAGALAYPALLLVFGIGVVVFLTTTTLPQLAQTLEDAGAQLPRTTRVLLSVGSVLTQHTLPALVVVAGALGGSIWLGTGSRTAWLRLRVPLLGRTLLRTGLASSSLLLARLLRCGIPLTEALALTAPTVRNAVLRNELLRLRDDVRRGRSLAETVGETTILDPVFCRVVAVGEESGELPDVLERLGVRYRDSAARLTDRLAAALEPVVILLLAVLVGFVVFAAITPMLELTRAL